VAIGNVMVSRRGVRNAGWGPASDPVDGAMAAGALRPRELESSGDVYGDTDDMLRKSALHSSILYTKESSRIPTQQLRKEMQKMQQLKRRTQ
jgi:hypothetical protein